MRLFAMMSIYEEEQHMIDSAINSCNDLDGIMVFDGPTSIKKNKLYKEPNNLRTDKGTEYTFFHGHWKSDADKRSSILDFIKNELIGFPDDAWILWLDGDEILLYGEYLINHCIRADQETATGGSTIRIVEYDGSVAQCYGKLIKVSAVKKYVMSSYEIELENGMTVALPNVPICTAGGIPIGEINGRDDPLLATNRPPLIGEPHLLHRHGLRNPERKSPRLHDKEAESFEKLVTGFDENQVLIQDTEGL